MYVGNLNKTQLNAEFVSMLTPFLKELKELTIKVDQLQDQLSNKTKEYYSSKELETILGVSRSTIHNWSSQGKLHKYLISEGKVLYKWADVEKLINYSKK